MLVFYYITTRVVFTLARSDFLCTAGIAIAFLKGDDMTVFCVAFAWL